MSVRSRPLGPGGTEPPTTGTKECTRCHQTLHVLAFAADRKTRDGLHIWCRECCNRYSQGQRFTRKRRNDYTIDRQYDDGGDLDPS